VQSSCEMHCVLMRCKMHRVLEECIKNKAVPEIHFAALLQLKAPARAISVESTLALNPRCFGAKVVYVRTPGTCPPHCKAIRDSLSVLPKLEKSQETCSNTLHMANYCPHLHSLYPPHPSTICSQVPCRGTQEHKALV
jgi:hypothetical protein